MILAAPQALGLLAHGVRVIAQQVAKSPSARKKVQEIIASNIKKSTEKGLIPTTKTIGKGLTKQQKGLLDDFVKAQPKTTPKPTGRMNFGERTRAAQAATAEREAAAAAQREAAKQAAARNERVSNIVKGAGLSILPLSLLGGGQQEEEPQPTPQPVPVAPTDPRFMQVINPSYESTSKELLNSALLRAGLSMASGGNLKNIVDSAASVGDFETKFRTGEEAFAAGRRNLGEAAKIYVSQDEDGFYQYTGSQEGSPEALLKSFMGEGGKKENIGQGRMITPEIIAKFKSLPKNINISDEELIKELLSMGFVEGEMV